MPIRDRTARREYHRQWRASRRAAFFATAGPCVQCGSTEDLELDHIDRGEKISHRIWSWSAKRRAAELAKCQVLCRRCHLEKTREENRSKAPCGTRARYVTGCRCADCRKANREYVSPQPVLVAAPPPAVGKPFSETTNRALDTARWSGI